MRLCWDEFKGHIYFVGPTFTIAYSWHPHCTIHFAGLLQERDIVFLAAERKKKQPHIYPIKLLLQWVPKKTSI